MYTLFKSYKFNHTVRNLFTSHTQKITLKEGSGCLIKLEINGNLTNSVIPAIQDEFIRPNPNCLFIVTMPTCRLKGEYGELLYPGHNLVFISNDEGEITSTVSKRPNTRCVLSERKRAPDRRFHEGYSPKVKIYSSRYTSFEEEIMIWAKKNVVCKNYPLYIHRIPMNLSINEKKFREHIAHIISWERPYILHSTIHPTFNHYLPADNCNSALYEAIFGAHHSLIQDMFCQEAAINIVRNFAIDFSEYQNSAELLGLTHGIEFSPLSIEDYYAEFTC